MLFSRTALLRLFLLACCYVSLLSSQDVTGTIARVVRECPDVACR
jgi:hypothetical protein